MRRLDASISCESIFCGEKIDGIEVEEFVSTVNTDTPIANCNLLAEYKTHSNPKCTFLILCTFFLLLSSFFLLPSSLVNLFLCLLDLRPCFLISITINSALMLILMFVKHKYNINIKIKFVFDVNYM